MKFDSAAVRASKISRFVLIPENEETECWRWTGATLPSGFCCFSERPGMTRSAPLIVKDLCTGSKCTLKLSGCKENRDCVSPYHCTTAAERFGSLLKPTQNGCLEYQGEVNWAGYGRVHVGGKRSQAHRYAWELANGKIPDGMVIRHLVCDNPTCCNVDHLAIGTQQDNMDDMNRAGRRFKGKHAKPEMIPRGQFHGMAKLTEADVISIREEYLNGKTTYKIGEERGLHPAHVGGIVSYKSWKHIPVPEGYMEKVAIAKKNVVRSTRGEAHYLTSLTAEKVVKIREAVANKEASMKVIGERFGVDYTTVSDIARGKSWKSAGGPITPGKKRVRKPILVHQLPQAESVN